MPYKCRSRFETVPVPLDLETGDLIFYETESLGGSFTRCCTRVRWDHVGIIVNAGTGAYTLECVAEGIHFYNLAQRLNDTVVRRLAIRRLQFTNLPDTLSGMERLRLTEPMTRDDGRRFWPKVLTRYYVTRRISDFIQKTREFKYVAPLRTWCWLTCCSVSDKSIRERVEVRLGLQPSSTPNKAGDVSRDSIARYGPDEDCRRGTSSGNGTASTTATVQGSNYYTPMHRTVSSISSTATSTTSVTTFTTSTGTIDTIATVSETHVTITRVSSPSMSSHSNSRSPASRVRDHSTIYAASGSLQDSNLVTFSLGEPAQPSGLSLEVGEDEGCDTTDPTQFPGSVPVSATELAEVESKAVSQDEEEDDEEHEDEEVGEEGKSRGGSMVSSASNILYEHSPSSRPSVMHEIPAPEPTIGPSVAPGRSLARTHHQQNHHRRSLPTGGGQLQQQAPADCRIDFAVDQQTSPPAAGTAATENPSRPWHGRSTQELEVKFEELDQILKEVEKGALFCSSYIAACFMYAGLFELHPQTTFYMPFDLIYEKQDHLPWRHGCGVTLGEVQPIPKQRIGCCCGCCAGEDEDNPNK